MVVTIMGSRNRMLRFEPDFVIYYVTLGTLQVLAVVFS